MQIHVAKNGQQTGPFDEALVREKLAAGEFAPTDLAWHADLAGWQPLATLFPPAPASPEPAPMIIPPAAAEPEPAAAAAPFSPVVAVPVDLTPPAPAAPPTAFPPSAPFPPAAPAATAYPPPAAPYGALPPAGGGYAPLPVAGGFPGQMPPPQFYNPAGLGDPNLATVGQRILGLLVDGGVHLLFVLPALVLTMIHIFSVVQNSPNDPAAIRAASGGWVLVLGLLGNVAVYLVQGFIFSKSSQTIGKKVMGTRVVLLDGQPAPLVPGFILRTVLPNFGISLLGQIPLIGGLFSCVGLFYYLTDFGFLFRQDRRCVHDFIGGTKVVRA